MTAAFSSQGAQLKRGDGATPTEAFTLIAEVTSINGPSETAKQIDVTSLDSTAREYIAGLRDGGEVTFEGNFVATNAQQQGIRTDLADRTVRNFQLVFDDYASDPTSISFAAVVTNFSLKSGVDQQVTYSVSLKVSGVPTYDYHAAA